MDFSLPKLESQHLRKSLRKEWLETNGLGDYASSTAPGCNSRRYHGLFVHSIPPSATVPKPPESAAPFGRHVLVSALEESVSSGKSEFFFSCRKHPGAYYPRGHEYLEWMNANGPIASLYRLGNFYITREIMMIQGLSLVLVRYEALPVEGERPSVLLTVKPLLAYRSFHQLAKANDDLNPDCTLEGSGFAITPYPNLPTLFMEIQPGRAAGKKGDMAKGTPVFEALPDWYYAVEYFVEKERGFPFQEDLFKPGHFTMPLQAGESVLLSASVKPFASLAPRGASMQKMWDAEIERRAARKEELLAALGTPLLAHLAMESERFIVRRQAAPQSKKKAAVQHEVIAGYHWFDAWGRDTMIALPGLAFCTRDPALGKKGAAILYNAAKDAKNGLVPNCYSADGNHAYNSVDASLWYVWAVQQMLKYLPEEKDNFVRHCWPFIKKIIAAYSGGGVPLVSEDQDGFLHVGTRDTQLTWMDATAYGRPVTPRNGCPVEIMALWYNLLAFANSTAAELGEPLPVSSEKLKDMSRLFRQRYFTADLMGSYLSDVWSPQFVDTNLRPNQLFALSLPFPILAKEESGDILARARTCLVTPFGMRTLAPSAVFYHPSYKGGPDQRDSAYHQGTAWPWLIGAFGEVALAHAWDKEEEAKRLLLTFQPLFVTHLYEAGMRSVSEVFDGDPPHLPDGCIAQAWSVAESLRLLMLIKERAPGVFAAWAALTGEGGDSCGF